MTKTHLVCCIALLFFGVPNFGGAAGPAARVIDASLHHLRISGTREWDEFPESPESERLEVGFDTTPNPSEWTLQLRQQDVKQTWTVRLNDRNLGTLTRDENDMVVYFPIPAGVLRPGENLLIIEQTGGKEAPDDIRVGELTLHSGTTEAVLSECAVSIRVTDEMTGKVLPSRITVMNATGALQTVWREPSRQHAVRPGTVFTATGEAAFRLPAGKYQVFAGRGFEYSLARAEIEPAAGEPTRLLLKIRREVPTPGWIACDPHVHTLTHSGHGDATAHERMVTLAGEAVELAVATDHNVQIDHAPFAEEVGVSRFLTTVIGNEVTTPTGHFNIFPVPRESAVPDHRSPEWQETFSRIQTATAAPIVILNHARDLHNKVRPFGPLLFNDAVGEHLDGRPIGFNGMEVLNSGATQSDPLQLTMDWMTLLNRGVRVTPVGSSDSHDVSRHFVGQARTYLRCADEDPGNIDVTQAVESFRSGRVVVSYGLFCEIAVGDKGAGEVLTPETGRRDVTVRARVLGPHWTSADRIRLFVNGELFDDRSITPQQRGNDPGVQWSGAWELPVGEHDVHLVAVATGPGIDQPWWRTAKPYQPTSPDSQTQVFACSGAVWIDADRDRKANPARQYAEQLIETFGGDQQELLAKLNRFDAAVATQAAFLLHRQQQQTSGKQSTPPLTAAELPETATKPVRHGFQRYFDAWRRTETARIGKSE